MKNLFDKHVRFYKQTPMSIIRQCGLEINWDTPLLALRGSKGVGKSTIMLQYIKQHYSTSDRTVLYCSCDGAYFVSHTLLDLVSQFYKNGGKHLFLDEIHTIIGAGGAEGALDAANILKPSMARGEIQLIGATTINEYRKHIEKDAALERRFQPIMVEEPDAELCKKILEGLKAKFEEHHRVIITDDAIDR